jgi:RNA polymerase sigma factor (sigma-70 family)
MAGIWEEIIVYIYLIFNLGIQEFRSFQSTLAEMNDSQLWLLFLQGNKQALSEIFLSSYDDLFRYGLKLIRELETVDDCIQNLFLKLWKNRQNLKPVMEIKPYLFRSLRNHIIDILEIRKPVIPIDDDIDELFILDFTPEDFIISDQVEKEKQEKIIQLLNKLTPRQRHVIYLRYFEDMEFETIAQIMDMKVQSVRNSICRGLQVMRELISI